jgi:hypothetical protein
MPLDEIVASLYPWDLADEGVDRCLDNLQRRAGVNSAYLVGLMHKEKRPLHQRFYPHNPVRKLYLPEDSRVYWKPDPSNYESSRIKPLVSERDFLKDHDWLDELIAGARARGMRTGCEISHTIIDADVLHDEYPDAVQLDVFGAPIAPFSHIDFTRALPCLNHEAVRDYLVALVTDLADNHDIDFIQTCMVLFGTGGGFTNGSVGRDSSLEWQRLIDVATGGCFCPSCEARARKAGLDFDAMRAETTHLACVAKSRGLDALHEGQMLAGASVTATSLLVENPHFAAWLRFRAESVTETFKLIHDTLSQRERKVELRYNTYLAYPELAGLDFVSAFRWVDSVRESDYSDQTGTLEGIETKRRKLLKARRALGYEKPLIAALGVRPHATPDVLKASVKIAVDAGCDGLSLGHYDGATMERLAAVKEGVAEAEGTEASWIP